ncbi:MAG TPA: transaldolase family protein [Candidatus Latescibacteria bacterium]|nr:transaldolase family protein [Candidatus Latescibacterota bacterium]
MRIFLDTAKLEEIQEAVKLGIISGVTTNPSLMMRAGRGDYKDVAQQICHIVQGPVSAEVISTEAEAMIEEAKQIAQWSPYVVVKIPATVEGLKAISTLSQTEIDADHICQGCSWQGKCYTDLEVAHNLAMTGGIRTNATLTFSLNQALFVARAGATYVSPFVGRLDDIGDDGMELVAQIVGVIESYGLETQVIAASIRHPLHIAQAALAGAHIATVPYKVLMKAVQHPLTDIGLERFAADWTKVSK